MTIAILIVLVLVLALLAYLSVRMAKDAPDRAELARLRTRDDDYQNACRRLDEKALSIETLQSDKAKLGAELENEKRTSAEKLALLQNAETRLKTEFENLANRIFEDKGKSLTEQNRERLHGLLQPFKEQLESFRLRVDEVHKNDTEQSVKLLEQVRQLHTLSNKVSDEANNLAKAIKGDTKKQGDWGELIVERILEASGLERGREFEGQIGHRAEDGSLKKPDFVVYLPGDRAVIVDSKVSLTAFDQVCAAEEKAERNAALAEHVQSVRRHVEELRGKDYSALLGNRTLDFVLMCIPLEPAYQTALQADPDLLYDLARSPVVVTGPTTLMITLKLIAQIWRREHENRHAATIAERAGRLYDQVALIAEAMIDARKKLEGVSETFDLAMKRLTEGRGNLIGRVEELRRLGAKVNKSLPAGLIDQTAEPDEDPDRMQDEEAPVADPN